MKLQPATLAFAALFACSLLAPAAQAGEQKTQEVLASYLPEDVKISRAPTQKYLGVVVPWPAGIRIEVPGHVWTFKYLYQPIAKIRPHIRWNELNETRTYEPTEDGLLAYFQDSKKNAQFGGKKIVLNISRLDRYDGRWTDAYDTGNLALLVPGESLAAKESSPKTEPQARPDPQPVMTLVRSLQQSNTTLQKRVGSLEHSLEAMQSQATSKNSQAADRETMPVAQAASARMP